MRSIRSASPGVSFSLDLDTLSDEAPATIFFQQETRDIPFCIALGFPLPSNDPVKGTRNVMMTAPITLRHSCITFNLQKVRNLLRSTFREQDRPFFCSMNRRPSIYASYASGSLLPTCQQVPESDTCYMMSAMNIYAVVDQQHPKEKAIARRQESDGCAEGEKLPTR